MKDLTNLIFDLEKRLAQPEVRSDTQKMSALLADDFVEFGASGRRFDKQQTLRLLAKEHEFPPYEIHDFQLTTLSDNTVLVTYAIPARTAPDGALQPGSRRSSIWQQTDGGWQILFHQGTWITTENSTGRAYG